MVEEVIRWGYLMKGSDDSCMYDVGGVWEDSSGNVLTVVCMMYEGEFELK